MRYRELGKTGMKVSVPALGGYLHQNAQEEVDRILSRALEAGINYIDTAHAYGTSQRKIGAAISHRRDEFYLATKTASRDAEGARRDMQETLEALQIERVDVCQVHAVKTEGDLERVLAPGGALESLEELKSEGRIGHIGITSHRPDLLVKAIKAGCFETVLFFLNPLQTYALEELIPLARERGVGTVVMKPLASGWLRDVRSALRFVLAQDVDTLVPGLRSLEELEEALTACEGEVSEAEAKRIQAEMARFQSECRWCNLCAPCPEGIDIPRLLSLSGYLAEFGVPPGREEEWSKLVTQSASCAGSAHCQRAALCEIRCPYHLSIRPTILRTGEAEMR